MGFFDKLAQQPTITIYGVVKALKDSYDESKIQKGYNQGFDSGYDKGVIDTKKKFAAELERDSNFRFSAFALGFHISKLAGNPLDKVSVIVSTLGNPNSKLLDSYVRSENKKIIDGNLSFYEIQQKYLKNLSGEDLKLIDEFLKDVVDEGDYNSACSNFYNNDWKNYLRNNSTNVSSNQSYSKIYFPSAEDSTEMICDKANKHYYGLAGYKMDRNLAFSLYKDAADKGHSGAKNALKTLYNYNY